MPSCCPGGCCCISDSLQSQLAIFKSCVSCMQHFQQSHQPCLAISKPSCCICSLPPTALCGERLGGHCALFHWAFLVTPTAQGTDLPGVCGGKATWNAGRNSFGTQEKHVVPARRGCGSLCPSGPKTSQRHLKRSLDWKGLVCGLPSQVTGPHTNGIFPMGPH